jgi:hypothetical protein
MDKLTQRDQVVIYCCCILNEIIQVFQFVSKNNEWRALNNNGPSGVAILHYMGNTHMHLDGFSHGPSSGVAILHYMGDTHMHLDGCSHGPLSGVAILHYIGDTHLAQYDHLHGLREWYWPTLVCSHVVGP